jgi:IS1 family transposase
MNQLSTTTRCAIVRALVEGNSIRATARLTGTSKATVLKLLVDLGEMASLYQSHVLRNLPCKRIQCDEIWSFVGAKERAVKAGAKQAGDVWTWTALCADTKLMVSYLVGKRDAQAARGFMDDLKGRLANRVQLTTDGHRAYLEAVDSAFGADIDYAMLIKLYGGASDGSGSMSGQGKYSPAQVTGIIKEPILGNPVKADVSTSFVERQNLTMRMGMRRLTRLTNAFSKKVENHAHAVALHFLHYNFVRPHQTLTKARKGYPTTPAMAAGLAQHPWTVEELVALLDSSRPLQSK